MLYRGYYIGYLVKIITAIYDKLDKKDDTLHLKNGSDVHISINARRCKIMDRYCNTIHEILESDFKEMYEFEIAVTVLEMCA